MCEVWLQLCALYAYQGHVYFMGACIFNIAIPYVGMMYGYWQQSLALYAQLLFAPAVNSPAVYGKQQRRESAWKKGGRKWHKVKAFVNLVFRFIQIT